MVVEQALTSGRLILTRLVHFGRDPDQKDHALGHAGTVVRAGEAVDWRRIGRRSGHAGSPGALF